jgi:hypothetical protein
METDERLADVEPFQQNGRAPGVLGCDDCDILQNLEGSERDIA